MTRSDHGPIPGPPGKSRHRPRVAPGQVMEGEDAIVDSMRRFANDAKCVEYLKTFKETKA